MSQTILVVEDDPANLRLICYVLRRHGYSVLEAGDGVEALELMSQFKFDLVLSGLRMPRMDGVALARHIVSNAPRTVVLLMTAYAADDLDALSELRVPCLKKPFMLDRLKSEIQTALVSGDH